MRLHTANRRRARTRLPHVRFTLNAPITYSWLGKALTLADLKAAAAYVPPDLNGAGEQ